MSEVDNERESRDGITRPLTSTLSTTNSQTTTIINTTHLTTYQFCIIAQIKNAKYATTNIPAIIANS